MSSTDKPKLNLPLKIRVTLSLISAITNASRRPNGTVNRTLFNFFDRKCSPNATPVNGVSTKDVTVNAEHNVWFRLFTPTDDVTVTGGDTDTKSASLPVVVFFHGGGFTFLSPSSLAFDAFCRKLCREIPAVVVSVNYRLSPEHRYPAQYDDGEAVLKFLDEDKTVLPKNADVAKCFLAGDSAGGNLAHNVAVRVCKEGLRKIRIVGLIALQPFFGGEEQTESEIRLEGAPLVSTSRTNWLWKAFLPEGSNRDHGVANVSGPNGEDLSGLDYPDTLVFVGGFDPLIDWQKRYYDWLRKNGKNAQLTEYPNMFHGFYVFPELPESFQLVLEVKDFINKNRVSN
ncbi:probable carboxylesterase 18 [Cicer arietinum]|uniref:Probable carboxylesterase 18 n=1 Tax=Cicer arietinum TaxID=3827 RepID=A0A1S2Z038_CICAR|nr:probable carboxylesterase 18 [Cicer arietinum]